MRGGGFLEGGNWGDDDVDGYFDVSLLLRWGLGWVDVC